MIRIPGVCTYAPSRAVPEYSGADADDSVLAGVKEVEVGQGDKSIYWRTVVKDGSDEGVVER